MKKVLLPLTWIVLMLANAGAEAGTQLDFTATVVQSCTLSMSSNPLVVDMGRYPTSYFPRASTYSPRKPFEIHISGCAKSKIALKWTGNIANGDQYLLAVNGAKGLGILVGDQDKNRLSTFTQTPQDDMFITMPDDGNYNFHMIAFYKSYLDSVTAGPANASATVEVIYG
ncbi:fimbrial protein [Erwinia piriflorinigrans]|uniref:Fimbrin-like protein fimI n=1 Tax=Erwinia piriflorinigrans CFBP 5888 TaxID=1161919 RepID=V5ZBK7_9GAMM|nr:fimbrial protein [Erwinia piriflorinigrans]CCG88400.1 Fimbrin-like protein fimI [Erwinia piriflorinigrans CFBP 5888]